MTTRKSVWKFFVTVLPCHLADFCGATLVGIMAVGDDSAVDDTWIMGHRAYNKGLEQGLADEISSK